MGKRLFQQVFVSTDRTKALGLPQLQVVSDLDEADKKDTTYHTVHGEFPRLKPGANAISWTGSVTRVVVRPNWRYL